LFKWIKQHLRIKASYGTSENSVNTRSWIAVSVYVLVAIVRKRLGLQASLYQILQILSLTLFEKTPILRALQAPDYENDLGDPGNQLILFDFYPDTSELVSAEFPRAQEMEIAFFDEIVLPQDRALGLICGGDVNHPKIPVDVSDSHDAALVGERCFIAGEQVR
jgi:hypothetical protein